MIKILLSDIFHACKRVSLHYLPLYGHAGSASVRAQNTPYIFIIIADIDIYCKLFLNFFIFFTIFVKIASKIWRKFFQKAIAFF